MTRSAGEKKVNSLLDFVSLQAKQSDSGTILEDFYAAMALPGVSAAAGSLSPGSW